MAKDYSKKVCKDYRKNMDPDETDPQSNNYFPQIQSQFANSPRTNPGAFPVAKNNPKKR